MENALKSTEIQGQRSGFCKKTSTLQWNLQQNFKNALTSEKNEPKRTAIRLMRCPKTTAVHRPPSNLLKKFPLIEPSVFNIVIKYPCVGPPRVSPGGSLQGASLQGGSLQGRVVAKSEETHLSRKESDLSREEFDLSREECDLSREDSSDVQSLAA